MVSVQRRYRTVSSAQKQINAYAKAYFWGLWFEEERRETRGEVGMYEVEGCVDYEVGFSMDVVASLS